MELVFTRNIKTNYKTILNAWNEEFGESFPLTEKLIDKKLFHSRFTLEKESICVFKNDNYIGSIFFKLYDDNLYISFIHVVRDERFKGYGKLLIEEGEKLANKLNANKIILGSDPDCLFSGVFMEGNDEVQRFFSNQGFKREYLNYNLITRNSPPATMKPKGFRVEKANEKYKEELLAFLEKNFSKRWLMEVENNAIDQVYLLLKEERITGFINSALSSNEHLPNSLNLYQLFDNLAGIGPLGIDPDYQSKGLGKYFVNYVIRDLFRNGASEVMVDWTGLVDFYLKCGFEEVFKTYVIYSKKVGMNKWKIDLFTRLSNKIYE